MQRPLKKAEYKSSYLKAMVEFTPSTLIVFVCNEDVRK